MQLPVDDKHNYSRDYLLTQIAILLGGRIAEEMARGDMTTGAGNDIERATELARKMVCEWGMSDALGPLTFGKKEEQIFLGREIAQHQDYSEDTAMRIDQEVRRIVMDNYKRRAGSAGGHRQVLDAHRRRAARPRSARRRPGEGARRRQDAAAEPVEGAGRVADAAGRRPSRATREAVAARSADSEAAAPGVSPVRPPVLRRPSPDGRALALGERTLVMGILNVTPDSFSDGGRYRDARARRRRRRWR